ncbi:MAG: hypothetical protein ABL921_25430 [Pirellula sp.]
MNRASCFFLGLAVGIAGLYMTMHITLVRAADGFHVVPKIAAKAELPYTDIRNFTLASWQRKQALALSILRAKKGYLIQDPSLLTFKQSTQKILDQFSMISSPKFGS